MPGFKNRLSSFSFFHYFTMRGNEIHQGSGEKVVSTVPARAIRTTHCITQHQFADRDEVGGNLTGEL
jgi:hypothetical protein